MMMELESHCGGGKIVVASFDHARMKVEADVSLRLGALLHHLAGKAPATTAEIDHDVELPVRHVQNRVATAIFEGCFVCRPDQLAHFVGRDRDRLMDPESHGSVRQLSACPAWLRPSLNRFIVSSVIWRPR